MADEHPTESPPGTPGRRALGAMESAVRRARESAGAPPLSSSVPLRPSLAPPRPADGRRSAGRDRWLIRAVAVVAALIVAAAVALLASLSTSTSSLSHRRPLDAHDERAAPLTVGRPRQRRQRFDLVRLDRTSTSTSAAVVPAGPPGISSLSPSSGSAGQTITVAGANFLSNNGQILATFNGQVATTSCPTQNTCIVTAPSSTVASAQVVITTSSGPSNAVTFTYG